MTTANHRMPRERIDAGILLGTPQTALCGETFTPTLRVGSGGSADMPGWPACVQCEEIAESARRVGELRRELAAAEERFDRALAGRSELVPN